MKLADGNKPINIGDTSFIYKGVFHPIYWIGKEPYRPRVETLVIKDARMVYLKLKDGIDSVSPDLRYRYYSIPGGSLDADSTKLQQAEAETNEEALIKVNLLYNTGISYYELYEPGFILKGGDMPLEYTGSISDVFIGVYSGPYDKSLVDEKDLDDEMANKGKFYNIIDVAKYLRKEHVEALINSQFVADDVKAVLRLNRHDVVNESSNSIIIPNKYIYHASTAVIDEFKPMSLDFGNYDTRPGWVTFCFDDYNYARMFGLLRAIQSWAKDIKLDINPVFNKGHIIFTTDDYKKFTYNTDIRSKFSFYVYTIDSTPLEIGIGNDASLKEYTFKESGVKPEDVDKVSLSLYDVKELVDVLDDYEIESDNDYKKLLSHEYNEEDIVRKELTDAISNGKLKPGDDVVKYMEDNGIYFKNDDISIPNIVYDIDEPVFDSSLILLEEKYPIECYGLPDRKAYPMPDKKHVKSAIRFFNYANEDEEKELASNINKKIKEFKITDISVGDKNRFKKYYKPINESFTLKDYCTAIESSFKNVSTNLSNKDKYKAYENTKGVIRMMVTNLEAGTVKDLSISDDELGNIIDSAYTALAEITSNQMELMNNNTKSSIRSIPVTEACKDLNTARKFVTDVQKIAKKYDANFFLVTDGASGYSNGHGENNPAVKNARNAQIEWEKKNGFDPDEDWSGTVTESSNLSRLINYRNNSVHTLLEADDEEDDIKKGKENATDYTELADEETPEEDTEDETTDDETEEETPEDTPEENNEEDTGDEDVGDEPTDYAEMADNETEDIDNESDGETNDNENENDNEDVTDEDGPDGTEETGSEETDDETSTSDGEEIDTPTDYAEMADDETGSEDTETGGEESPDEGMEDDANEDTSGDEDTGTDNGETSENNNRYDNKELKNYFLLNSFLSLHETVVDVLDSVNGMILPTPDANKIMASVVKNLQTVKSFIEKFIQFQFSETDYAFNLYYYNILTNSLKMNLKLFEEAVNIGDSKSTKKSIKKED